MATNTYKCTVCKRQVERVENVNGLDIFAKCIITGGCRGKLRRTGRNLDNIRESFPKFETNLEDYIPRNSFASHIQTIAASTWLVKHGLNCEPTITVFTTDASEKYVPLDKSAFEAVPVGRNTTKLIFPVATAGIVHFNSRSSSGGINATADSAEQLTQVTTGGSFVFAVPKLITKDSAGRAITMDLKNPIGDIKLEVIIEKPNEDELYCAENLSGMLDSTPWTGIDEIVVGKRKSYYLKTKNVLNFRTFNDPDITFADIPEGTRLRFVGVDYGTGVTQKIEYRSVFILLSAAPYAFADKIRNKLLDLGELNAADKFLTYSNGEFFVDSAAVEKTYPPIEAARKVGAEPPLPSFTPTPTPTPTTTGTPTPTVTPTLSVTPTVTLTRTVTPTPTTSVITAPVFAGSSSITQRSGCDFVQNITATGGLAPYYFELASGALPLGVSLAPNGQLVGQAWTAEQFYDLSFNFTVRATGANGASVTRAYSIYLKPADYQIVGYPENILKDSQPTNLVYSPDGNYLVTLYAEVPYMQIHKRVGDFYQVIPESDIDGYGMHYWAYGATFTPDSSLLAVTNGDGLYLYKRTGDTFALLTGTVDVPLITSVGDGAGFHKGVAFSPDGSFLVRTGATYPYVIIYERSGDNFTKLPAITGINRPVVGIGWSPDGTHLALGMDVGGTGLPLTVLKVVGNTFTKLTIPIVSDYMTGALNDVAYSPDGTYLFLTSYDRYTLEVYKRTGDTYAVCAPANTITGSDRGQYWAGQIPGKMLWHPDGERISAGATLHFRRIGDSFSSIPNFIPNVDGASRTFIAYSPDGAHTAVAGSGGTATEESVEIYRKICDYPIVTSTPTPTPSITPSSIGDYNMFAVRGYYNMHRSVDAAVWTGPVAVPQGSNSNALIGFEDKLFDIGRTVARRSTDGGNVWVNLVGMPAFSDFGTQHMIKVGNTYLIGQGATSSIPEFTRSTDGLNFATVNPTARVYPKQLAALNGIILAGGSGGFVNRSEDDGLTWSRLAATGKDISALIATETAFIAFPNQQSGNIHRSTTGLAGTWTAYPYPQSDNAWMGVQAVAYGNGRIVAIRTDGYSMYSLDDGVTWTLGDLVENASPNTFIFAAGKFYLGNTKMVFSSADGIIWDGVFITSMGTDGIRSLTYVLGNDPAFTPTPTPTQTPTPSPSRVTPTPTPTKSVTPTPTLTPSITPTISVTPTITPTISVTPTITPTISVTPTQSPSFGSIPLTAFDPAAIDTTVTLSDGNLTASVTDSSGNNNAKTLLSSAKSTGKWYFEGTINALGAWMDLGLTGVSVNTTRPDYLSELGTGFTFEIDDGNVSTHAYGSGWGGYAYAGPALNDVFQIAINMDTGEAWFKYVSSATWAGGGNPTDGTLPGLTFTVDEPMVPAVGVSGTSSVTMNFGATAFTGTVPTGFTAWG